MRRIILALALGVLALAGIVVSVGAIQHGEPDGNGHPYVGLVVFYGDEDATVPLWRCTGTLISPTVVLTAGHCAEDFTAVRAQVWFNPEVTPAIGYPLSGGYLGTPYSHDGWTGGLTLPDTHDIGVVVLDRRVRMAEYGALPQVGVLDDLATQRGQQDVTFTVVGYGLQSVKPTQSALRTRYVATTKLNNLTSAPTDGYNLHLSSNPGNWSGGICFGDSGGPVFLNDTNIIVAVNSFVMNSNCKGAGFGYRVDTSWSLEFVNSFLD
jgi:secreted trypsin-like serine protease